MAVKNIVKIMNFHALLRVNKARQRVEKSHEYEKELKQVISSIVNNRIFKQENVSFKVNSNAKELNIYIGSDLGFCSSFNADVTTYLKSDNDKNDKIVVGKRINSNIKNVILFMNKEEYTERYNEINEIVLNGILQKKYSKINIIYIHYYDLNRQEIIKRTIFPFNYSDELSKDNFDETREDYVVEGDLNYILLNLISIYVFAEIRIAEAWSWASENVERQKFTDESLKKIEEKEEEMDKYNRKLKHQNSFKSIVDMNNRKNKKKGDELQ